MLDKLETSMVRTLLLFSQLLGVWRRVPKGTVDAVLSYCHNTLNDKSLLELLPYFAEKGVGVISASVTSMGLFTKQASTTSCSPLLSSGSWPAWGQCPGAGRC